ncbi:MAG: hypothetical protein IKZ82_13925 [Clostridia bacterium]|nr:hypothetical protein [Clostridia bacterium]
MINHAVFNEKPEAIAYMPLADGKADIWLRKNIHEYALEEGEDGDTVIVTKWSADEAYMREKTTRSAIEADFDGAFSRASVWQQGNDVQNPLSVDERIALLEKENAELFRQLTETQLALCELYETMI